MDSASPKTPTKKRTSWFGSVKSKISPSKSIPGDENASPKDNSSKKSVGRRFADSIRLHISKKGKEQQEVIIGRPRTTSPCKSHRITDKHISKRKSLSSLFTRTLGSYKTRGSYECGPPPYVVSSCEMRNSYESYSSADVIGSCEMSDPQPAKAAPDPSSRIEIVETKSTIETIVANMTDNRYFYPPKFWETVSVGEDLLRKPKPYKSLRDIPSKDGLRGLDLDRYLEESIDLRTPRQLRPSSHKLRYVSTAAVRVKFPGSGHIAVYTSRDKAIADLYEKSSQLADYAIWDPVARIIQAFPLGQEVFPALTGVGPDATQYIWLPINSWFGPQNPPANPRATVASGEDDLFKEIESFDPTPFVNDHGSLENDSFKEYEFAQTSPRGAECKEPAPSPHHPDGSSLAELSADEFGLDFETDSNMDQAFCKNEPLEEDEPLARPVRIEDIVRPESVSSSWYIPYDESRICRPIPTWKDLGRKCAPLEGRSLSQASTALESAESSERSKGGMSACEVAMAAVAKDAFNVDLKVWDGFQWIEILACGMASDNNNLPDLGDIEVVAAVDHVEHVSAPTDLETYFQPEEILQTIRTIENGPEGACPNAALCCHFHDASGRPLTLRCPHPTVTDSSCCHDHETSELFVENGRLGDCVIRVIRELAPSQLFSENEPSAEEALSILDEILRITAAQDAEVNIAESLRLTEEFEERKVSNASFLPGFKFSIYGDILEEESICSTGQNAPDSTPVFKNVNHSPEENNLNCTTALEKANHSPRENECNRTALAVLENFNIRPVGKAALQTKPMKNVRALVDIFQSRDLMPQTPPILQSNSRIATPPPRFLRSNGPGSEQGIEVFNVREFVHDWGRARPGSVASNADTDVSSKFGEALERFGGVAFEDTENH